ncbi:CRISPR-associated helicase/endonuclease Cas3, partial [Klebsiella pneumoniae]|nr:CRISPR-associated helicase/endonuclease Cas3 [Klebsiella pneumoniae]
ILNFAAGYSPESSDFLPEKLSTRPAEESITLGLARIIDGVVMPYAPGEHAWEMSAMRVRQGWWNKHRADFTLLDGKPLQQWCVEQHQNQEFAVVIVVSEVENSGYSACEGLIGMMEV